MATPDPALTQGIFAELAETIDQESVARLAIAFPGERVYMPKKPPVDGALVGAIGLDAALKLARRYGGTSLMMPVSVAQRARIIALHEMGCNVPAIARRMLCTQRQVWGTIADWRKRVELQ